MLLPERQSTYYSSRYETWEIQSYSFFPPVFSEKHNDSPRTLQYFINCSSHLITRKKGQGMAFVATTPNMCAVSVYRNAPVSSAILLIFIINQSAVHRSPCNDDLRSPLESHLFKPVIVNQTSFFIEMIWCGFKSVSNLGHLSFRFLIAVGDIVTMC